MKNVSILLLALSFAIPLATAAIINEPEVYSSVTPENGSLYLVECSLENLDNYSYYYEFNLSNLDLDTRERCRNDLVLEITSQNNSTNWIKPSQRKTKCSDSTSPSLIFKVNFTETFKEPFLGELKYRLIDKGKGEIGGGKILEESTGPRIVFVFRNEETKKIRNDVYNYSVQAISSINNSTVYILYEDSGGKWDKHDVGIKYTVENISNPEWRILKWPNTRYFHHMEFVPDLSSMQTGSPSRNNENVARENPLSSPSEPESSEFIFAQEVSDNASSKSAMYSIAIGNSGDCRIRNITVNDTLPENTTYKGSSFKNIGDGTLEEPEVQNNTDGTTTLTWLIGDLNSGDYKIIQLRVIYSGLTAESAENKVKASGSIAGHDYWCGGWDGQGSA